MMGRRVTPRDEMIVREAHSWLGTPYRHQGSLKHVGCDCLGLVRGVWRDILGPEPQPIPPYAKNWDDARGGDALLAAIKAHFEPVVQPDMGIGDVLLFRLNKYLPPKHCAILVSDTQIIHAQEHVGVVKIHLSPWWRQRLVQAAHFPKK